MARQTNADLLDSLRRQQAELATRLKEAEEKQQAEERSARAYRAKIAGQITVALLEQAPLSDFAKLFRSGAGEILRKAADRALFDLPPIKRRDETETLPLPPPAPPMLPPDAEPKTEAA